MTEGSQALWLRHLGESHAYNDWIMSQLRPHLGRTVLEVGCGSGNFTELMAPTAEYIHAVDLDPRFVAQAAERTARFKNVTVALGDAAAIDVDRQFDSVVMLDVLEHLENDIETLRRLRSRLRERGTIIVKVPAIPAIYNKMDRAVGHFRRYKRSQLQGVMKAAGFDDVRIWGFNLVGALGWWVTGSLLGKTVPSKEISLFNSLVPVFRKLEAVITPPVGLSLFAVGTTIRN